MLRQTVLNATRRRFSSNIDSTASTSRPSQPIPDTNIWQETKNRQGRIYYVNTATGMRTWDHPGENATVLKIPKVRMPEVKNMSERVYHLLVNSTNAYYGLFFVFCAGIAYRIMNPPKPAAPTIGPISETK